MVVAVMVEMEVTEIGPMLDVTIFLQAVAAEVMEQMVEMQECLQAELMAVVVVVAAGVVQEKMVIVVLEPLVVAVAAVASLTEQAAAVEKEIAETAKLA